VKTRAQSFVVIYPMRLGDVISALPIAGLLKRHFPGALVTFIGTSYTKPLVEACAHVDRFLEKDAVLRQPDLLTSLDAQVAINPFPDQQLAKLVWQARIPVRIGNLRRPKSLFYCNRFVNYSRFHSSEHMVFINLKSLAPLGIPTKPSITEMKSLMGLKPLAVQEPWIESLLRSNRLNLVLHPKSGGEGREWPVQHYLSLAKFLPADQVRIFVTGTAKERAEVMSGCPGLLAPDLTVDLMGRLPLDAFLALLSRADGIVASGTGPLHIAAAYGIHALGLFPPAHDINPLRWAPFGPKAETLCLATSCSRCTRGSLKQRLGPPCFCTEMISALKVAARVLSWLPHNGHTPEVGVPAPRRSASFPHHLQPLIDVLLD
jgi:heptosyltransferase-3